MTPSPDRRRVLVEQAVALRERLTRIHDHVSQGEPVPADFSEAVDELANRPVLAGLDSALGTELQQIEHALHRLDEGLGDRCEACGQPIAPARLQAMPAATLCRDCAATGR